MGLFLFLLIATLIAFESDKRHCFRCGSDRYSRKLAGRTLHICPVCGGQRCGY